MTFKQLFVLIGLVLTPILGPPVVAQAGKPVELVGNVQLRKLVTEGGQQKEVLQEPKLVVPGDRLAFSTAYRNTGAEVVNDFVVTNPLPDGIMLDPAGSAPQEVSVDGGKRWGALSALTVADGEGGQRPAQPSDVTHVRWTLATLRPGASGTLTYHAIVR